MDFSDLSPAERYAALGQAIEAESAIAAYQLREGIPSTIHTLPWMRPPPPDAPKLDILPPLPLPPNPDREPPPLGEINSERSRILQKIVQDTNRRDFETRLATQRQNQIQSLDRYFEEIQRPGYSTEQAYGELSRRRQNLLDDIREQNSRRNPTPPQTPPPTTDRKPPPTSLDNAPALRTAQTSGARAPVTATAPPRPAQPSHWNLYQPPGATPPPATRAIPRTMDQPPTRLPQAGARGRLAGAAGVGLDLGHRLVSGQDIGQAAYGAAGGLAGGLAGQGLGQAIGAGIGAALGGPPGAAVGGTLGGFLGSLGGGYAGGSVADRYYPGNNAPLPGAFPLGQMEAVPIPRPIAPNPFGLSPGAPFAPFTRPAAAPGLLGFEEIWTIEYSVRWTRLNGSPGVRQASTGLLWGSPPILSLEKGTDPFGNPVFKLQSRSRGGISQILENGQPSTAPQPNYVVADVWLGSSYKSSTQPTLTILNQTPINYGQPNPPPAIPRPVDPAYTPTPQNAPRPNPNNSPNDQYQPNPLPQTTPSPTGQPTGEPLPGNLGGNEPELQPQRSPDRAQQPTPGDRAYPPGASSGSGAGNGSGNSGFPTIPLVALAAVALPAVIRARLRVTAQRPTPTTQPRGSGQPNPPPPPSTPEEPCRGNRCSQRQLQGIDDANLRLLRLEQGLLGGADLGANAAILAKLDTINAKLGAQIPGGGIASFIKKLWDSQLVTKILNMLTFVTVLHNAYMLSNNITQTLFSAFDTVLEFFGTDLKNAEGEDISTSQWIGDAIEGFFNNIFGTETVTGIKADWKKFNRIYQAASNIISSFQSMMYSVLSSLEVIGNYVAQIGNAAKKFGVFADNCYRWMNPNNNFTQNKYFNALNNTQEAVETIDEVAGEALSIQETGAELFNQKEALSAAVAEVIPGDTAGKPSNTTNTPQHQPSDTFENKLVQESQKVLIPIPDSAEVRQEPPDE